MTFRNITELRSTTALFVVMPGNAYHSKSERQAPSDLCW
jgi:hypothetical protein